MLFRLASRAKFVGICCSQSVAENQLPGQNTTQETAVIIPARKTLAGTRYGLNTRTLKGMINRIKFVKRGLSLCDTAPFFLKIKAALPVRRDEP